MKDFDNPKYYFNRELSWLKFNQRVLQESIDRSNPLMEKLRFLTIGSSIFYDSRIWTPSSRAEWHH